MAIRSFLTGLVFLVATLANGQVINLPQTGQTRCWDSVGVEIPCEGTGQDGDIRAGVECPTPRFTDHNDGTVTDNCTGLMWTKHAGLGPRTWSNALEHIGWMNKGMVENYGYSDWRMANAREMVSLFDFNDDVDALPSGHPFDFVDENNYYSSTRNLPEFTPLWGVRFLVLPGFNTASVMFPQPYWPVRGGVNGEPDSQFPANVAQTGQVVSYAEGDDGDLQWGVDLPEHRFLDTATGVVVDRLTGLMWTKDAIQGGTEKNWPEALLYVRQMNDRLQENYGYSDWRLPNVLELFSLIDKGFDRPALPDGNPFVNNEIGYWSSTTRTHRPDEAFQMSIGEGALRPQVKEVWLSGTWPVRGPFSLSFPLAEQTPATTTLNAVFDHSMTTGGNCPDDVVVAYTGETGEAQYGGVFVTDNGCGPLFAFQNENGTPFVVNGNYTGGSSGPLYLAYDGHTGHDFNAANGTNVYAVARGIATVVGGVNDEVVVDHGNGYTSHYLHLSAFEDVNGEMVERGVKLGEVGLGHLHFTLKLNNVRIDPYGWRGTGTDPYTDAVNIYLWDNLECREEVGASMSTCVPIEVVFADGFESGDTSVWSETVQ